MLITQRSTLERNLELLERNSPGAAEAIRAVEARADLQFVETDDGVPSVLVGTGPEARQLASRRRPLEEAERLAGTVDVEASAAVVVLGFGAGHHVGAVARRLAKTGVLVVFEPDVGLLRGVLERIDHSDWIERTNLIVLTDASDTGAMSSAVGGLEGVLAMGLATLEHPPSRARLGDTSSRFMENFTGVMRAVRTTVVTTLVQVGVTLRNATQNLDRYTSCPGVASLEGVARGRPAIVVSAGPSLARNIDELARPGVRDRFVIVAVQTVLRTLLERGIRPHFVTALDYHEISRRFYEGLTPERVRDVTLVVEPKANPAILESYPGPIRCVGDEFLDRLLGPRLRREMGRLQPGATVAHLAYYLSRHLGCDPVVLVGQDLGFTDGQYYAAHAAAHRVWAAELNEFRTLEMMEWERIARARRTLRRLKDVRGGSIYTDEQMSAYLVQFERDFAADRTRGLGVIDATEGGVAKQGAATRRLRDVIDAELAQARAPVDPAPATDGPRPIERYRVMERVRKLGRDAARIAELGRTAARLLTEMLEVHADQGRVNELIGRVYALRDEAVAHESAFGLVQYLNQIGVFNRVKADRSIHMRSTPGTLERQRREIERDVRNVEAIERSSEGLRVMLERAAATLEGASKMVRDEPEGPGGAASRARPVSGEAAESGMIGARVVAVVGAHTRVSPLGRARDLGEPLWRGRTALALTLDRLARVPGLASVVLVTEDARRLEGVLGASGRAARGPSIEVVRTEEAEGGPLGARARGVRASRAWSDASWRGGPGNLSVFDEVIDPALLARILSERGADGAMLLGADWSLIDPALCAEMLERFRENPEQHRLVFSQAGCGLGPCVVSRSLAEEMGQKQRSAGPLASFGGVLGYVPIAPAPDMIASSVCVQVEAGVRDVPGRCIADTPEGRAVIRGVLDALGEPCADANAGAVASAAAGAWARHTPAGPPHLRLRLVGGDERMDPGLARLLLHRAGELSPGVRVTLSGRWPGDDPLAHESFVAIVRAARQAGAEVHVRTGLTSGTNPAACLAEGWGGVGVVSVDLLAEDARGYAAARGDVGVGGSGIDGGGAFERVHAGLMWLLANRVPWGRTGGLPECWVLPRITRCDATLEQIEAFHDRWIMLAGGSVIDPPGAASGRITALPVPALATARALRSELSVGPDGVVEEPGGARRDTGERDLAEVWAEVLEERARGAA
ncbi:MAG: DUF115 domain-containing protein [Phycisphaerae bacterium]|nr:DUF115 domain-containing protein [Phycisphaerae bacterium]